MTLAADTSQEQLTPEARRGLLRAFADRMLIKATAMDDPEDMPGIERAVRVAAVIERLYSRCDPRRGSRPRSAQTGSRPRPQHGRRHRVACRPGRHPAMGREVPQGSRPLVGCRRNRKRHPDPGPGHRARPAPGRGQACSHSGGPGTGSTYGPYSGCRPDATGTPDHRRKQNRFHRRHAPAPTRTGSRQSSRHDPVFPQDHANLRPPGHLCRLYRRHRKLRVALGFDPMPDDEESETPPGGHDPPSA
ncbi:MAG: hypothetical protein WDN06_06145 [Asticcacaulis sp.]